MASTAIIGTELKFNLHFGKVGLALARDYEFSVRAYTGSRAGVTMAKGDCIVVDDSNFFVMVDTTTLGTGILMLEVTAYIPDDDFPDGLRTEIARCATDVTVVA